MATATAAGPWVEAWPVSGDGVADLDWLVGRLKRWSIADGAPFVALSLANNETGVIQPVAQASALIREAGGWLHVDAVQAAGKIPVDFDACGADTLSLSAHKLGGPQGAGALVAGSRIKLQRRQFGGGQEGGQRAGTENLSGIAGFGAASVAAADALRGAALQATWRDKAADRLKARGCSVAGEGASRLPGTLCIVCDGYKSELQVMALDLAGVMVSAGAACSSGKVTPSAVLRAMGLHAQAGFAIRASGGWDTTEDDWPMFADVWLAAHARHAVRAREYA